MRHVLVIEDDSAIRRGIVDALKFKGYGVSEARTGRSGQEMAIQSDCELVLLDLVLPDPPQSPEKTGYDAGLQILSAIRASRPALPVIILTAKGDENDRVQGLKLGADDYVVKPFSIKELLARVEAVLRRSAERPVDLRTVSFPEGRADLQGREVTYKDGSRRELSEREAELLRYLAINPGRPISRDEILTRVWRIPSSAMETRTIDMHVARLREKLRDAADEPQVLVTVRGKGYMFRTRNDE